MKRIFHYIQGTKDKGLLFDTSKKMVVYCYADADFWDCGYINNRKTLFVLGVGMVLWQFFPIFLYCVFQNYRQIFISLLYITIMCHWLIILETYFH